MLLKIPFETSAPILEQFNISEEAAKIITIEMPPEEALSALFEGEHMVDMLNYFAHGMPPREGVCWAIATICEILSEMSASDRDILELSKKWVKDPQESLRIRLMIDGEGRNNDDPIRWLCCAIAWNGSGSIGPQDGPVVLPPHGLYASALMGAVSLLVESTQAGLSAVHESAHRWGLEVAQGGWPMQIEETKLTRNP